jgi:uncharacterized membrane protein YdjX (TVP38/TMEM64 family)
MTMQAVIPRLLLALILAAAALWLAVNRDRFDLAVIESAIRDLGMLAPVAHVVFFALGTVLFIPGAIFGLAGSAKRSVRNITCLSLYFLGVPPRMLLQLYE